MTTTIPDGMPILSAGKHANPKEGACIMEYASFLNGERWTDRPSCTHPTLAGAAQVVNDALSTDERQALLPLLPRLMGTAPPKTGAEYQALATGLAQWCAVQVSHLRGPWAAEANRQALMASQGHGHAVYAVGPATTRAICYTRAADPIAFLSDLIDEHDRLTGRTTPTTVTATDLQRCAELTRA